MPTAPSAPVTITSRCCTTWPTVAVSFWPARSIWAEPLEILIWPASWAAATATPNASSIGKLTAINVDRMVSSSYVSQSSGRFRNAQPPDAQPDVYIVAESVAQLARSGGRDESRRPYRKPPQDLSGPSGPPTSSSAVQPRHMRAERLYVKDVYSCALAP